MVDVVNAALKGMQVSRTAFNIIGENISNANNPNYSAKVVNFSNEVIGGQGVGVSIASIVRRGDEFLQLEVRARQSIMSKAETIDRFNQRAQLLFGQPGDPNTLNSEIDDFFNALNFVSNNSEFKLQTVQKAASLADRISDISKGLYQLRYDADRELSQCINVVNQNLLTLQDVQAAIDAASHAGGNVTTLEDTRDEILVNIGENIEVSVSYNNNLLAMTTTGGLSLYDSLPYQLYYDSVNSTEAFINNIPLGNIIIYPSEGDYNSLGNLNLVTGGKEGEVTTKVQYGKMGGLLQLRDKDFPEMIKQLDQLAARIRDSINEIHNSAGSVPSSPILTGTNEVSTNNYQQFSGSARVAMIDLDGQPIKRADGSPLNPLLLNFDKLDSGIGFGAIKTQTLIDEINQYYYYDPLLTKTKFGNLEDVRIASRTSNMTANGIFDFDFEVLNNSNKNSIFSVESIAIYDNTSTALIGAVTTTLPVLQSTTPGDRLRSDLISVNFGTGAGGPYTIRATVKNIDENNVITTSVLDYIIDDTPSGGPNIMNNRYVTNAIVSGNAQLISPSSNVRYMQASLVDKDGNNLSSGQPGFMNFKALSTNHGIIIDNLNSEDNGFTYSNGTIVPATYRGMSHFFELNNLFTENPTLRNSAYNMGVREDILENSDRFCIGKISRSANYTEALLVGESASKATIEFTANPAINSTITINGATFTFVAISTANDEITLGANLAQTLTNTLTVLNATNNFTSGTAEVAIYTSNGTTTLTATCKALGTIGNQIPIGFNLLGGAAASLNKRLTVISDAHYFIDGTDNTEAVDVIPNSYELGVSATQAATLMALVGNTTYNFSRTLSLASMNITIGGYGGVIVSTSAGIANQASVNFLNQSKLYTAFYDKYREGSGVDIDQELGRTIIYQNTYSASATILQTANKLSEILLDVFRRT